LLALPGNSQTEIKKHVMKAALAKGVTTGVLIQVKSSYKVSAEAKKPPKKKPVKKVAAKKATAPKKKVRSRLVG
jgi:histone H1/5